MKESNCVLLKHCPCWILIWLLGGSVCVTAAKTGFYYGNTQSHLPRIPFHWTMEKFSGGGEMLCFSRQLSPCCPFSRSVCHCQQMAACLSLWQTVTHHPVIKIPAGSIRASFVRTYWNSGRAKGGIGEESKWNTSCREYILKKWKIRKKKRFKTVKLPFSWDACT